MSVVIVGDSARRHAVCPYQHFAAELGVGARDTRVHYGHHRIGIAGCHTPSGRGVYLLWPPLLRREEWIVGVDKRPIHVVGLRVLYAGHRMSLADSVHEGSTLRERYQCSIELPKLPQNCPIDGRGDFSRISFWHEPDDDLRGDMLGESGIRGRQ